MMGMKQLRVVRVLPGPMLIQDTFVFVSLQRLCGEVVLYNGACVGSLNEH